MILTTPYQLHARPYSDALGFSIVQMANRDLAFDDRDVTWLLVVVLVLSVAFLLAPRFVRRPRLTLGITALAAALVVAWNLAGEVAATNGTNNFSQTLLSNFPTPPNWLDRTTGGQPAIYLGQRITDPQGIWLMEFWNRSLRYVWSLDATAPGPGLHAPGYVTPDVGPNGRLGGKTIENGAPPGVNYIVADQDIDVAGTFLLQPKIRHVFTVDQFGFPTHKVVVQPAPWRVLRIAQPLRLRSTPIGIENDGWITPPPGAPKGAPAFSAYNLFSTPGQRPGYVHVTVSRAAWNGQDKPGRVTILAGRLIRGKDKQPALGKVTTRSALGDAQQHDARLHDPGQPACANRDHDLADLLALRVRRIRPPAARRPGRLRVHREAPVAQPAGSGFKHVSFCVIVRFPVAVSASETKVQAASLEGAVGTRRRRAPEMVALAEWPGADRRRPSLTSPKYTIRAPLAAWLDVEARRAAADFGRYRVLDVGCGAKPYYPLFAAFVSDYVGVDIAEPSAADVIGPAEAIPLDDGMFDLVLCTQVLEHADDPARVVRELRRVIAPGGRVLVSTHGVQVYHPAPVDLWRWTHAGLERLFRNEADWASVSVQPGAGTTACVGMLTATYFDLLAKRLHVRPAGRPVVAVVNAVATFLDRRLPVLSGMGPGGLHANYHLVAEAPR